MMRVVAVGDVGPCPRLEALHSLYMKHIVENVLSL